MIIGKVAGIDVITNGASGEKDYFAFNKKYQSL
jgi:hypothetical protein